MPKEKETVKDFFNNIGGILTALSILLFLFIELVKRDISSNLSRFVLIFSLLFLIFLLSMLISIISSRNNNAIVKMFGFSLIIVFFAFALEFMSDLESATAGLFNSVVSIGAGWLILIPGFAIPISSFYFINKFYDTIKRKYCKTLYILISIIIAISSSVFFLITKKGVEFFAKSISGITIPWIQVLSIGLYTGIVISLCLAPIYPLFIRLFGKSKKVKKKKK